MRLATLAFTAFAAVAAAQNPILVNAAGTPFPVGTVAFPVELPTSYFLPLAQAPNGQVYIVLDASLPTGYYAFDVVDVFFNSLSQLAPEDRVFYAVNHGAAGFTITRVSSTPSLPAVGLGLGGVGNSMPVFPYNSPLPIAGRPDLTCVQKAWLQSLGPTATGVPTLIGFHHFRAGDGSPGSVSGVVFEDLDHDGIHDAGEPGVAGAAVKLVSNNPANPGQVIASTLTDANGQYSFSPVGFDDLSVVLDLNTQLFVATTPTDVHLSNCGCGNQVVDFGKYSLVQQNCNGRTIGFWRNNNGVAIIVNGQFWDELVALHLVNANGTAFNPTGNISQWRSWLQGANATNMAYMLSAQLAAMELNVLSGGVSATCFVSTSQGPMQIGAVMAAADAALAQDGYTPTGDAHRALQTFLKNVLDAANNNLNWL
jgi:hypothetical protein